MPDELITIFKICFLVLLYLFFFRVLRAVWSEVATAVATPGDSAPAPARLPTPSAKESRAERKARVRAERAPIGPSVLVALEPPELAGVEYGLADGLTIGRGGAADIVLDDNFLSTRHASFEQRDGAWLVVDHRSTNGTYLNGIRVDEPSGLRLGDRLQLGGLVLEVR